MAINQNLESQIKRLEEIVKSLDIGNKSLDEHIKEYEEGLALANSMRKFLDEAHQRIIDITKKYQA